MTLREELAASVNEIFSAPWESRAGTVVPSPDSVGLENDAVHLEATVLYADLAESTELVDNWKAAFAAEVYKAYLECAARIIRHHGGHITAYDGDRIMSVFLGESEARNTHAALCALHINWAVLYVINPSISRYYRAPHYAVKQAVGVDSSKLLVARTGIRGSNDLVWVGRAANYAAKMCSLRVGDFASWISDRVFASVSRDAKTWNGEAMWTKTAWAEKGIAVHASNWWWRP